MLRTHSKQLCSGLSANPRFGFTLVLRKPKWLYFASNAGDQTGYKDKPQAVATVSSAGPRNSRTPKLKRQARPYNQLCA